MLLARLAGAISRRPRRILLATLAAFLVAAVFGGPVFGLLESRDDDFADPNAEWILAEERLEQASGRGLGFGMIALVRPGGDVTAPAGRARVAEVEAAIERDPAVAEAVTFVEAGDPAFVSRDRTATFIGTVFRAGESDAAERIAERLEDEPGVVLGGGALAGPAVGEQVAEDLARAEMLAFPLLFLLSLWVFRGLVAALLPLFVGALTVVGAFLALRLVNEVLPLSNFAINLVIGLGLGLSIDYSLFVVSRYREELARVGPGAEALRNTLRTAGRTVLFSTLTVAVALAALCVFPQRFLYSMGIGGAAAALLAAATSLIALPALLAVLGPRVNALPVLPRWRRAAEVTASGARTGFWYRLSRAVMRRPGLVAAVSAAALILVGLPFLRIEFTGVDASVLPEDRGPRQVSDALERDFPANRTSPITLALDAPATAAGPVGEVASRIDALPGVAAVTPPEAVGDGAWRVDVFPREAALDEGTQDLVRDIRAVDAPFPVLVTGETAQFVDQQESLADSLPLGLVVLACGTFILLFLMTGSVVLPLKALLINVLGLSAALGLLVLIFQDGRFEGLLGYESQGALEATQPILLFAIAFGLSTDYGVFLLTRIKEARDGGLGNDEAVAVGLERTGRIVTAAALLLCVAIGAFATSEIVFIKQLGVGTALAVLIDAFVIRALLVPSLMALLGEANWWAPRPLRRLHDRFGLQEAAGAR